MARECGTQRRDNQRLDGAVRHGQHVLRALEPDVERAGFAEIANGEAASIARDRFGGPQALRKLRSVHLEIRQAEVRRRMAARAYPNRGPRALTVRRPRVRYSVVVNTV